MSGGWKGSDRRSRLPSNWNSVIRPRTLEQYPICVLCGVRPSVVADHIKAKTDDHTKLQGVCGPCHDQKSSREGNDAQRANPRPRRKRPEEPHPGLLE